MMLSARTMYMSIHVALSTSIIDCWWKPLSIIHSGFWKTGHPFTGYGFSGFISGFRSGASRIPVQYTTKASKKKKICLLSGLALEVFPLAVSFTVRGFLWQLGSRCCADT